MPDRGGFATLRLLFPYHGRIAERGRHAHLLAAGGLYAAPWARQQENTAAPAD